MVNIKDKDLYAIVGQEVANGSIDIGLWTKAISECGGNEAQAKSLYLKMRVLDLSEQRETQQKLLQQQACIQQQHKNHADKAVQEKLRLDSVPAPINGMVGSAVFVVIGMLIVMFNSERDSLRGMLFYYVGGWGCLLFFGLCFILYLKSWLSDKE